MQQANRIFTVSGVVLLLWFLAGWLWPHLFWASNAMAFGPTALAIGAIALSISSFALSFWVTRSAIPKLESNLNSLPALLALVVGLLAWLFPMAHDIYGDSYKLHQFSNDYFVVLDVAFIEQLFSFNFSAWQGEQTGTALAAAVAWIVGVEYGTGFRLLGAMCGAVFAFVWARFVLRQHSDAAVRTVLLLAGTTAPFLLNFFGHLEIYAPVLLIQLAWLVQLVGVFQRPSGARLMGLLLLWLIHLKLHATAVLLLLPFALALLWWLGSFRPQLRNLFTPAHLLKFVLVPCLLGGMVLYFFVFGDHFDSRDLSNVTEPTEHLFLPLFAPEAPLDRYNLFSLAHIWDFLNLLLMCSPIVIPVLIWSVFTKMKAREAKPEELTLGIALISYAAFFFALNPLLSMPIDWDLFTLITPVMLVGAATWSLGLKFPKAAVGMAVGIAVLCLPWFSMHTSVVATSSRFEQLCRWNYQTYYTWTSRNVDYAMGIAKPTPEEYESRMLRLIEDFTPDARPDGDPELAALHNNLGVHYLRVKRNNAEAIRHLKKSLYYMPSLASSRKLLQQLGEE